MCSKQSPRPGRNLTIAQRALGPLALALALLAACGNSGSPAPDTDGGADALVMESFAPLCDDIAPAQDPKALFTHAVLDPSEVSDAIVFGDMEPSSPQEVLNYELGFYIPNSGVALTAPGDLYVESIERSHHPSSGVTDWGISYHVCSYQEGNTRKAGVFGNFAHITSLNADLSALFDEELAKLLDGQPSAVVCSGPDNESCGLNLNRLREIIGDPEYALVVEAGAPLGTGGPAPGKYAPAGIDANLIDRRINDFAGNYYINPDRLGAEDGPGLAWRYGACTYEYFAEPYRSQYLAEIRVLGEQRASSASPCGTLEVDREASGTIAGLWSQEAAAGNVMGENFGGGELDAYLSNLLVLADHLTSPDTKMMLSTPIDSLSNLTGAPAAIEIDKAADGDANWNKLVNVPFKLTAPGSIYCYAGNVYGSFDEAFYLAEVSQDGDTLTLERVGADCTDVAPGSRTFDAGSANHFVFLR